MRKALFISFVIVFSGHLLLAYEDQVSALATTVAEQIAQEGKTTAAVVDFTDLSGNVTELGRFLAEELSVSLANTAQGIEIVDRTHLRVLMKEHKLANTGIIDPATVKELGRIAGVDAMVTGTLTPFGDSVRLTIKVLDIETARIICADSGNVPKTSAIEELLNRDLFVGEVSSKSTSKKRSTRHTARVEDLLFELVGCTVERTRLTCAILITDEGQGRELKVNRQSPKTRVIDSNGNQYLPVEMIFGSSTGDLYVKEYLTTSVPTRLALKFKEVPENISLLKLLEIGYYDPQAGASNRASIRDEMSLFHGRNIVPVAEQEEKCG